MFTFMGQSTQITTPIGFIKIQGPGDASSNKWRLGMRFAAIRFDTIIF